MLLMLCHSNVHASDEISFMQESNAPLLLEPQLVNAMHEN